MASSSTSPGRRAHRALWVLIVVAVLAAGGLSRALGAAPGPAVGLLVGVAGTVVALALTLAARVLLALEHARRRPAGR